MSVANWPARAASSSAWVSSSLAFCRRLDSSVRVVSSNSFSPCTIAMRCAMSSLVNRRADSAALVGAGSEFAAGGCAAGVSPVVGFRTNSGAGTADGSRNTFRSENGDRSAGCPAGDFAWFAGTSLARTSLRGTGRGERRSTPCADTVASRAANATATAVNSQPNRASLHMPNAPRHSLRSCTW